MRHFKGHSIEVRLFYESEFKIVQHHNVDHDR